jgi:hypothetical protein
MASTKVTLATVRIQHGSSPHAHTCHVPEGAGHDPADCPACIWSTLYAPSDLVQDPSDPIEGYGGGFPPELMEVMQEALKVMEISSKYLEARKAEEQG